MISSPEDYGLSEADTLGHRTEATPPDGFDDAWSELREAVDARPEHFVGHVDSPVNQVVFSSVGDVRVVGMLSPPPATPGSPRGIVVSVHADTGTIGLPSGTPAEATEPWLGHGLAVVDLYVRARPPSTIDIDERGDDWIMQRLESPAGWIVRQAVGDVLCVCRCLRRHYGDERHLVLHGDSMGSGLAVIAAAQLEIGGHPPDRLILEHPDLGDWPWRIGRYCNGPGGLVNMMIESLREDAAVVTDTLAFSDAAVHAAAVTAPTLAKLAARDDVVPAPAAAAVLNAIDTDDRWRFVTPCGHYDGGIANVRRHAAFADLAPLFADPGRDPVEILTGHAERITAVKS